MHLTGLHGGPHIVHGDAVAVHPAGEGVTRLVGDHLHVALGAVEVGEDEGHLVVGDAGAVAAARLALGGEDVQKLLCPHGAEEFRGLRGQLIVELIALLENILGGARGAGVTRAEHEGVVGKAHGVGLAQTLGLCAVDGIRHGDEVLHHGGAELLHVGLGVAVTPHAVVAQGGVALVAQLLAHGVAEVGQLVVDAIQLGLIVLVPLTLGLPCGQTAGIIGVGLEGGELGEGVHTALKGDLRRGDELLVGHGQIRLRLHLGDDVGGEGLQSDLGVDEHQITVLGLEIGAEGGGQQGGGKTLSVLLHGGHGGVDVLDLGVVELVAGVDGLADLGQGGEGHEVLLLRLVLQKDGLGGGVVRGLAEAGGQLGGQGLGGLHVGAGVGHFIEFHGLQFLSALCLYLARV